MFFTARNLDDTAPWFTITAMKTSYLTGGYWGARQELRPDQLELLLFLKPRFKLRSHYHYLSPPLRWSS
jgi:hypothetical protein